jgi:hypothetical protein
MARKLRVTLTIENIMARKKKQKRFSAVEAVKAMAREQIGNPPVEQVVPNRKKKAEKHKPTLGKLLEDTER